MSKIFYTQYAIDEVSYFISFFTQYLADYDMNELSNGHIADTPSINDAHPLALEYGNAVSGDDSNYASVMPAIGIELTDDTPYERQVLGEGRQIIQVNQATHDEIDAIDLKDRWKEGRVISDTNLALMQSAITAADPNPLYGLMEREIKFQTVTVSVWSYDRTVTRILYVVLRGLLHRMKSAASKVGLKNFDARGTNGLYNYDFDQTLFGSEFTVTFLQEVQNIEVDTELITIAQVEHYLKTGMPQNENLAGVTGVGKGE